MNDLGAQRAAQPAGYDPVGYVPVNSEQGHLQQVIARVDLPPPSLKDRLIQPFTDLNAWLDTLMGDHSLQESLDELRRNISEAFLAVGFEIDRAGGDNWYEELLIFLSNLPKVAADNTIKTLAGLVSSTLQASLFAVSHPLKAPAELVKYIILLAAELSKPENWSSMGMRMVGSNLGYALITPTPIAPIVLLIGAVMAAAGITVGALIQAAEREGPIADVVLPYIMSQTARNIENFATGFLTGVAIGGVQQAVRGIRQAGSNINHSMETSRMQFEAAKAQAEKFMDRNHLPDPDNLVINNGSVNLYWDAGKADFVPFPHDIPGAKFLMESVLKGYEQIQYVSHYVTEVVNGVTVTTPVYAFRNGAPIYVDVIGYQIPFVSPPSLPMMAVPPVANIYASAVLPVALAVPANRAAYDLIYVY